MCEGKENFFVAVAPSPNELYPPTKVLPPQSEMKLPGSLLNSAQPSRLVNLSSQNEDSS